MIESLLKVNQLTTAIGTGNDKVNVVDDINFTINKGRRFDKVVANTPGSRSVHCFVEKETGHIFKPAGWNAPQLKTNIPVRGSIYEINSYKNADPHGGWLYLR